MRPALAAHLCGADAMKSDFLAGLAVNRPVHVVEGDGEAHENQGTLGEMGIGRSRWPICVLAVNDERDSLG